MSERDALLAAITAEPDDDTPRLVYADWLDEHDEGEHAEFIRAQCRLEHLSPRSTEGKRLTKRAKELRAKLFGHFDKLGFADVTFRRGFVGTITSGLLNFRDNASALTAEVAPAYELIYRKESRDNQEFEDAETEPYVEPHEACAAAACEIFARPELSRCVSLDLPPLYWPDLHPLLSSPTLTNLRRLNAPETESPGSWDDINSPTFANLRWLNIRESKDLRIECIAYNEHLAKLEYLDFSFNRMIGDDLRRLDEALSLSGLRVLNLSHCDLGESNWGVSWTLFRSRGLPSLEDLDLSRSFFDLRECYSDIDDEDADAGPRPAPLLSRLSKLWLRRNRITDAGAEVLAKYPRDVKLSLLDLTDNPISEAGQLMLRERFGEGVCVFGESGE